MWFIIKNQQLYLRILAKPNAKQTALLKITEQGLHIAIHASPREGAANHELIRFLAELFHVPKTQISVLRGDKSKIKQIILPCSAKVNETLALLAKRFPQ